MDPLRQRRPDRPHLELAEQELHLGADRAQPLCDVRPVPPLGGHGRLRIARPDGACMGHIWTQEEVSGARTRRP